MTRLLEAMSHALPEFAEFVESGNTGQYRAGRLGSDPSEREVLRAVDEIASIAKEHADQLSKVGDADQQNLPADTPTIDALDRATFQPLMSTLPLDDPDFAEIVEMFVSRLRERATAMRAALEVDDFASLAELAHWLKGAGGTAGFDDFTAPAGRLQRSAEEADGTTCRRQLDFIEQLVKRIASPAPQFQKTYDGCGTV
jgi:HPt (histidine-containing phosphotransfer) domain-containing protein